MLDRGWIECFIFAAQQKRKIMNNFSMIILVWLAFFGGALAGVVATWRFMDRGETDRDVAARISKDFFKGLR